MACHYDVTTAQCAERRKERAKAKKQLKLVMNELKSGQMRDATGSNIEVCWSGICSISASTKMFNTVILRLSIGERCDELEHILDIYIYI